MKTNGVLSGGLVAAFLGSLCCITPVAALLAGTSGFAASFSWLEPGRPYLAGFTIAVLGFAWYQKLFPLKKAQDCACETDEKVPPFWQTKTFLGIVTFFALAMLSFPHYAHVFYPRPEKEVVVLDKNNFRSVEFKIDGMTCQGCAEHVMYEVNKLTGILKAQASFEKNNAVVEFDKTKVSASQIEASINSTGYKVISTVEVR